MDLFSERFLLALWRHFGRFLGCLGALLGGQVVFAALRYRSSLGWLLEAIWAHFGEVLGSKWSVKTIKNYAQK